METQRQYATWDLVGSVRRKPEEVNSYIRWEIAKNGLILTVATSAIILATFSFLALVQEGPFQELSSDEKWAMGTAGSALFAFMTIGITAAKTSQSSHNRELIGLQNFVPNTARVKYTVKQDSGNLEMVIDPLNGDGSRLYSSLASLRWRRDCLHPMILAAAVGALILIAGLLALEKVTPFDTFSIDMTEKLLWSGGALVATGLLLGLGAYAYRKHYPHAPTFVVKEQMATHLDEDDTEDLE